MTLRRSLAAAAALASVAALLAAAPPGPVFADHGDTNPGSSWQEGTAGDTNPKFGEHVNKWICRPRTAQTACSNDKVTPDEGTERVRGGRGWAGQSGTSRCPIRLGVEVGCGHRNDGGWAFTNDYDTPDPNSSVVTECLLPGHANHGLYVDDLHTECGMWVEACPSGHLAVEHRHATGDGHRGCETHAPPECIAGLAATLTRAWSPGHGHPSRQIAGCGLDACDDGQHRHGTDDCHADHAPPPCIAGVSSEETRPWTPDPSHGHAAVQVPGCVRPVLADCPSGQHSHAAAVPGGHQGCRAAHTAPSCTWSSAGTWSPGHGGAATDGHTTTTGMRVCVSVRHFCVDTGADNALNETVDRQRGIGSPDDTGLLPDGYHRDRIPYGGNLGHGQFKPRLRLGAQTSPAGTSQLTAGQWVAAAAQTAARSGVPLGSRARPCSL